MGEGEQHVGRSSPCGECHVPITWANVITWAPVQAKHRREYEEQMTRLEGKNNELTTLKRKGDALALEVRDLQVRV